MRISFGFASVAVACSFALPAQSVRLDLAGSSQAGDVLHFGLEGSPHPLAVLFLGPPLPQKITFLGVPLCVAVPLSVSVPMPSQGPASACGPRWRLDVTMPNVLAPVALAAQGASFDLSIPAIDISNGVQFTATAKTSTRPPLHAVYATPTPTIDIWDVDPDSGAAQQTQTFTPVGSPLALTGSEVNQARSHIVVGYFTGAPRQSRNPRLFDLLAGTSMDVPANRPLLGAPHFFPGRNDLLITHERTLKVSCGGVGADEDSAIEIYDLFGTKISTINVDPSAGLYGCNPPMNPTVPVVSLFDFVLSSFPDPSSGTTRHFISIVAAAALSGSPAPKEVWLYEALPGSTSIVPRGRVPIVWRGTENPLLAPLGRTRYLGVSFIDASSQPNGSFLVVDLLSLATSASSTAANGNYRVPEVDPADAWAIVRNQSSVAGYTHQLLDLTAPFAGANMPLNLTALPLAGTATDRILGLPGNRTLHADTTSGLLYETSWTAAGQTNRCAFPVVTGLPSAIPDRFCIDCEELTAADVVLLALPNRLVGIDLTSLTVIAYPGTPLGSPQALF